MIVDRINSYLTKERVSVPEWIVRHVEKSAGAAFARQFGEDQESKGGIRLSSIGRCLRQQAYKVLGVPADGKEIDSRSRMVFFQGDLIEVAIVQLARLSGCRIVACGSDQIVVDIEGVQGHPDGIIFEDRESFLFEAKSMSSYGFEEFEKGFLDEGYRYQCNAYMDALGLEKTIVVALNKDAGVLGEQIIPMEASIVADIHKRIETLKAVTAETLPERPYAPNEKRFYPWMCLYCSHHHVCLPNAEKVLVGKSYKLKEKS